MGRSRGGLTTKIHALVDADGLPIVLKITEGQAHNGRSAADMLSGLCRGQIMLADRAYDTNALRQTMTAQAADAVAYGRHGPKRYWLANRNNCSSRSSQLVPQEGFEPPTPSLRMRCSTD